MSSNVDWPNVGPYWSVCSIVVTVSLLISHEQSLACSGVYTVAKEAFTGRVIPKTTDLNSVDENNLQRREGGNIDT